MSNTKLHQSLFWAQPEEKLMYRIISETEVYLVQVKGRDLTKEFRHRHEKVTFPSYQRLEEDLNTMTPSDQQAWESMVSEYLLLNKEKLNVLNDYRQKAYNNGSLIL
jgi:hypothetical protein